MTPDQKAPIYFRIKSQMGANLDAAYSNVCQVNITPYLIDMSYINILNKGKDAILTYLYSPNSDGVYSGYMNVSSWLNCWGKENDGNIWGNIQTGDKPYAVLDNAQSACNIWFPEAAGIYYTVLDTKSDEKTITMTLLKDLKLNGEAMSYDGVNYVWTKVIETSADNTPISITATGATYDKSTGDQGEPKTKALNYALADGKMTEAESAGSVNIPTAGTYTVTVKVGEHSELTYSIAAGDQTAPKPTINNTIGLFSNDGNTLYATFTKVSDGVYTCTYDLKNLWNMRFYYVGDGVDDKQVCYGSVPNSQFSLYKEDGLDAGKRQGWDIWFNDDVNGKETVTITVDLNNMTWKYE